MRKPEQRLWDRIRTHMSTQIYIERIENLVGAGRPDIDAMTYGITIPLELKAVERYPHLATTAVLGMKHGLNQNQLNWWLRWKEWGGRGIIVIGVKLDVYLIPAYRSEEINSLTRYQLLIYRMNSWQDGIQAIQQEAKCLQNP